MRLSHACDCFDRFCGQDGDFEGQVRRHRNHDPRQIGIGRRPQRFGRQPPGHGPLFSAANDRCSTGQPPRQAPSRYAEHMGRDSTRDGVHFPSSSRWGGRTLLVHAPAGNFVLDENSADPVVLMSGGAGVTAALGILQHLASNPNREVLWVHATRSREEHAFGSAVRALAASRNGIRCITLYEEPISTRSAASARSCFVRICLPATRNSTTAARLGSWRRQSTFSTTWA